MAKRVQAQRVSETAVRYADLPNGVIFTHGRHLHHFFMKVRGQDDLFVSHQLGSAYTCWTNADSLCYEAFDVVIYEE